MTAKAEDDKYDLTLMTDDDGLTRAQRKAYEREAKKKGLDPKHPDTPRKLNAYKLVDRVFLMATLGRYNEIHIIPLAHAVDSLTARVQAIEDIFAAADAEIEEEGA